MKRWMSWMLSCAVLIGCKSGDIGPPNPVPVSGEGGGSAQGSGGAGGAATPKRTISVRNPFGGPPNNLMVDGDFEFSMVVEGHQPQTGWLAFQSAGSAPKHLRSSTGGLCRTGLRCAVLESGMFLFGKGAAANEAPMVASIWGKVPKGSECAVLYPYVVNCNFTGVSSSMPPLTEYAGEDGWCAYRTELMPQDTAVCMVVDNTMRGDDFAIVDSATLLATETRASQRKMKRLGGERAQRLQILSRRLRRQLPFGRPKLAKPPSDLLGSPR